jgi:Predicted drug exporters of the RND superfamily
VARLLARLGRFSAGRPWLVIVGWLVLLAVAGGAYLGLGGNLASGFSIPNTPTQQVTDRLADELEGVGGAVGTVVFQTEDGTPFTDAQRAAIADALAEAGDLDHVARVVDPFATADQLADQGHQLADGQEQLDAGREQLDAAQAQLDEARAQLEAGQAQLDAAKAQAEAAGMAGALAARFEAQQAELDAGLAQLEAGQQQLDDSRAELEEQQERVTLGRQLYDQAADVVTVSEDGATALGAVVFDATLFDLDPVDRLAVSEALKDADIPGVRMEFSAELLNSLEGLLGVGEVVGVLIAFVVLVVVFGALLPALLPLVSSIIGVGVGVAGSLAFSGVVDMASITPVLGVMLGLAVGIDYSLFIVNRHRRQLATGSSLEKDAIRDSIALANGTAGNAVVFAGSTVFIALLALNVSGIPFLGVMGTVAAACVLIAVLVAITLTPALLGLLGERVLTKKARARVGHPDHRNREPKAMPTWRALVSALAAVAVLLVVAIPALSLRLGLPVGSSEPVDSTQYKTYSIVESEFGPGRNGTLVVTVEPETAVDADDELAVLRLQAELGELLMAQDDVAAVVPVGVADDGGLLAFQVIPEEGPLSVSTEELVHELRALSPIDTDAHGAAVLGVAGQASGNIDISEALADALPVYLAVVIGLSILIMVVVFRSLLVPLIATGGFLLSFFAALGAVTAIYQWGWLAEVFGVHDPGPVLNFAPVILVGVLFGLAMDYQLFIASGMREAFVHGVPARVAVVSGVRGARAVVTAAAIIMISVFGGFVFSHLAMIRPLGFGMAVGVLFDAFVVRLVLMPALMHLLGRSAWWLPTWLDRILPDVDVEGASLERTHALPGTHTQHAVPNTGRVAVATTPKRDRVGRR